MNSNSRRNALKIFSAAFMLSMLGGKIAWAASDSPPLPANVMTPEAALKRLMDGNKRYVSGKLNVRDFNQSRVALAKGQNPYASILSCADSRVGPEFCFDEGRGDLFVNRLAGNFVTPDILASIEYGAAVLRAPVIMVLGHSECGAVKAAIDAEKNHTDYPGHIQNITSALSPAVKAGQKHGGNLLTSTTLENIKINVVKLKESTPLLRKMVDDKRLIVAGGLYHLNTGKVELVA